MGNIIKQPRWKKVEYSRNQIIKAGKTLRKVNASDEEKNRAILVIDNWRAAHAFPLHIIYVNLRRFSGNNGVIVAERLKRLDSIVNKLKREQNMNLWTMQDLGGCRVIVPTLDDVYKYANQYEHSRKRHLKKKEYDYIKYPKSSGYRCLHIVYEYHSDKHQDYNNNMLIEIQFRTHLQHLWATAVETMGLFTNQAIKAGKGSPDIKRFFVLVSSLFAIEENTPIIPNTSSDMDELIHEVESLNAANHYLDFLTSIKVAIKMEEDPVSNGYCVMTLNYEINQLTIKRFNSSEIEQANNYYTALESKRTSEKTDTVLVRVSSFSELKSAYPNYFSDISEFVARVKEYLN